MDGEAAPPPHGPAPRERGAAARLGRRLRGGAVKAVPLGAALALVGAVVLADRAVPSPMAADVPAGPLVVPVGRAELDESATVAVQLLRADGLRVTGRRAGVFTSVRVAPGARVAGGDVLATIDDRPVVAMSGDAPLYRDLGPGSRGPDVRRLEHFLAGLGLLTTVPDEAYDTATATAVRAFRSRYGLERGDSFPLAAVAWIGPAPAEVGRVPVRTGASAVPGEVLLELRGEPVEVRVADQKVGQLSPGEKVLVVGTAQVPYRPGTGRVVDPAAVRTLADALAATAPAGTATSPTAPEAPNASAAPSPSTAPGAQSDDALEGTGRIRPAAPVEVLTVPSGALVTDATGTVCVFPAPDAPPLVVHPLGGGTGPVNLPADTPLTRVLANPAEVLARPGCE
ncbi:peptidoglycan-binding protein [Kitasatospora phosalacinea]|uniref:Peptidoglycan-binding protein n=1 Tax=Kitasatospora phosalacinea TaxID=2065 RepID=A0ABW6GLA0_9ACTN